MGQQPDVAGKLRRALRDAGQHLQHLKVHLARIGLTADGVRAGKAHLLADLPLKRDDLFLITVKQGEEARARAGRALAAEELQVRELEPSCSRSISRSCAQSVARLPTVVGCAA